MRCAPPASTLPAEVLYYVPEPTVILLGCRPLVPDHARDRSKPCPVCEGAVRDFNDQVGRDPGTPAYCGQCDAVDPRWLANLERQRQEDRVIRAGRERAQREAETAANLAESMGKARLTERERRRIWNGYGSTVVAASDPSSLAKAGRDFLTAIGQEPDWSLTLDWRGHVVVRVGQPHS